MANESQPSAKRRRGPAPTGKGTLVGVRLQPPLLAALDKFITDSPAENSLTRPEAVRLLLVASLQELAILKPDVQ